MTYLNWGCNPLADECQSCLDAICNGCSDEFKKKARNEKCQDLTDEMIQDEFEPGCDQCDLEKRPSCSACEIILQVCRNCADHDTCEFCIT